jgi:hypothetical protein
MESMFFLIVNVHTLQGIRILEKHSTELKKYLAQLKLNSFQQCRCASLHPLDATVDCC